MKKTPHFSVSDVSKICTDLPTSFSNIVNLTDKRAEKMLGNLSPEQRLKADILSRLLGQDQVDAALIDGLSIDQLFVGAAEAIYSEGLRIWRD
jgi:hypothetical protein